MCIRDRDTAGLELVRYAQEGHRYMPILFQSKNIELKEDAEALGVRFLHKEDTQLYRRIEEFMVDEMNFGDFVFRMPDGSEVCLLYTSPSPRDLSTSRMPSSA